MSLKYTCPGCGTPLGYEGLCWKCKCERERNAALAWTPEQIAEKQKNLIQNIQRLADMEDPEFADFWHLLSYLDAITPETDLVFLCEPNNPTGVTAGRPLLLQILRRCRETGTRLVLDECFGDLLDDPESHTLKGELEAYPNLLILKAFTKLYAMAGIRLGYALCADRALLERMYLAGQPWSVSVPAQAAGAAALRETAYRERVRSLVRRERPCLAKRLGTLGLRVVPGEANYLLFQSPVSLGEPLARRGILLRSCDNYIGLDETWYRTAVRTRRQNQRLVEALEEIVK